MVGSIAVAQGAVHLLSPDAPSGAWLVSGLAIIIGAALVVGLMTPIASIAAASVNIGFAFTQSSKAANLLFARLATIDAVAVAIALAALGAGAFSLDAYLFGRREIIIPDVPRSPQ